MDWGDERSIMEKLSIFLFCFVLSLIHKGNWVFAAKKQNSIVAESWALELYSCADLDSNPCYTTQHFSCLGKDSFFVCVSQLYTYKMGIMGSIS